MFMVAVFAAILACGASAQAEQRRNTPKKPVARHTSESKKATVVSEVTDTFKQLVAAINQRDAAAWQKYYSKDDFVSAIAGVDVFSTRKAWVETITSYFTDRERQHVELQEVRVTPLAPGLALLTSQEKSDMQLKSGQSNKARHVFTMIWRKGKDGWKILHSHESWVDEPVR